MDRFARLLVGVFVALTLLIALPGVGRAAPAESSSYPVDTVEYNPCNLDPTEFTGTLHIVSRATQDATGVMHVGVTSNVANFEGIDLVDGTRYVGGSTSTNQARFDINPYTLNEDTLEAQYLMVSQGSNPNYVSHMLIHLTFDANGRLTSTKFDFTSECPG